LNYLKVPGLKKAAAMNIIVAIALGQQFPGVASHAALAEI